MIEYILILFFLILWSVVIKKNLGQYDIFLSTLVLMLFFSMRNYTVGTDTIVYVSNFRSYVDASYYVINPDVEYGYQLYEKFILSFTKNYFWFFFIISFFVISSYLYTIRKISINYILSLYVYITFGFYTFFFNGLRQGVAMAICFFGLPYLIDKRIIVYSFIVFIASFFHISALVMIPLYFIVNSKFKLELKFFVCLLTSILLSQVLIEYFSQNNLRYEHYAEESEKSGGYLTLIFYSLIGLVVYFSGTKIRQIDISFNKFEQILLCGLALVLPIALLGTDPSGPQRILYYFVSTVIFLIPFLLRKYESIYLKLLFIILSFIYFILITMRFSNLYPYTINPIFEIF